MTKQPLDLSEEEQLQALRENSTPKTLFREIASRTTSIKVMRSALNSQREERTFLLMNPALPLKIAQKLIEQDPTAVAIAAAGGKNPVILEWVRRQSSFLESVVASNVTINKELARELSFSRDRDVLTALAMNVNFPRWLDESFSANWVFNYLPNWAWKPEDEVESILARMREGIENTDVYDALVDSFEGSVNDLKNACRTLGKD